MYCTYYPVKDYCIIIHSNDIGKRNMTYTYLFLINNKVD